MLDQMREQAERCDWLTLDVAQLDRDQVFKAASAALTDRLRLAV
ncbi:hypothetical protein ACFV0W_09650 [Streptomyces anulatus]